MFSIKNDSLEVQILDPVTDKDRLGIRYCTGGYIFQVVDQNVGNLMSGPTFPDQFNWFDGQGIPDAFNLGPLQNPSLDQHHALILGIGICHLPSKTIAEPCDWTIQREATSVTFSTHHQYDLFEIKLQRTLTLHERTIRSATRVENLGGNLLPMRWFPHPFYPHPTGHQLFRVNASIDPIAHPAYELGPGEYLYRKAWPWQQGHFLPLNHHANANLAIVQSHPKLGLIGAMSSYIPNFFAVWGNQHTISWEPYLERTVGPAQAFSWWMDYMF